MGTGGRGHFASLPVDRAQRVNAACDRFEAAWDAGARPRIEDDLAEAPECDRPALLRELLTMELELRRGVGERPAPEEYRARFPADTAVVDAAFGAAAEWAPGRVLETIAASVGPIPRVLLPDTCGDDAPPLRPASPEMPPPADRADRYQLLGEMARGGMGAILRGRDPDLGRDLAVKVLLEAHRDDPELVRRFVEEAQIGGQLQHPGVVPVYELGTFSDRRPYFAMKLVRGRTLASLLAGRASSADDLPRFLAVFEQVCQTVAYAHARCVIHRDLKPSNVMVGDFGEVQVMDWGLAKVLPEGGIAEDVRAGQVPPDNAASVVRTVRSGSAADASHAGSVLGTPAYMPPEQAGGEVDATNRRADVFGLGAILCEVLTGKPPYVGRTPGEVLRQAVRGDLTDALARLGAVGSAPELADLARACLAADPADRPVDAGAVAGRVAAYLASVQERLRASELARAQAQARAEEERKRRRLSVALAASVVLTVAFGAGGWAHLARQRVARRAATAEVVNRALDRAVLLRGQARAAGVDKLTLWSEAAAAAAGAEAALAAGEPDPALRDRIAALRAGLERDLAEAKARAEQAEHDRRLVVRLDEIRADREPFYGESGGARDDSGARADAAYAGAFREAGLDPLVLSPAEVGGRVGARPREVITAVTAALDDWAFIRLRRPSADAASAGRLLAAARAADFDPWRNRLRDAVEHRDRNAYRRLAADPKLTEQPPASLWLLCKGLGELGDHGPAVVALRRAQRRYPGDFWLTYELGRALYYYRGPETGPEPARLLDAARFLTAALTLRPQSPSAMIDLGYALAGVDGKDDEAVAWCQDGVRLRPDYPNAYTNLAGTLDRVGRLDEAVAAWRAALRLKPGWANARRNLGRSLARQGKLDEAVPELREALHLFAATATPEDAVNHALAHAELGDALARQGESSEAAAAYREALRPGFALPDARLGLALCLLQLGRFDEAADEFRAAIRLRAASPTAHLGLAQALQHQGKPEEAVAALRRARGLAPAGSPAAEGVARALGDAERLAGLAPRFGAVIRGDDRPSDPAERVAFAELAYYAGLFAGSARLYEGALTEDARLPGDRSRQHAYNAACAAALAGSGRGRDDPRPDATARAALRRKAQGWLRAELTAWSKALGTGNAATRTQAAQALAHWKADPDLAGVRDPGALAQLPEPERAGWQSLWADHGALLGSARSDRPRPPGPPAEELPSDPFAR